MPARKKSPSLIGKLLNWKIGTLFLLSISLLANAFFLKQNYDRTIVTKVIDGDSFELADGRRIRLMSVDAPEKGRCFHSESRANLQNLIEGKNVTIEDTITDDYGRQLANVSIGGQIINLAQVKEGLARFVYTKNPYYEKLSNAGKQAKEKNLGIYSPACQNKDPVSDCMIKGNIKSGKIYHLPGCNAYNLVVIDESFGDQWFCTEKEAKAAGFRKAKDCK